MKEEMISFINFQRVAVLAVRLLDGCPHGATMHFVFDEDTFSFIFITSPTYKKYEPLEKNKKTLASLVIGFSEEEMKTVQLDGEVSLINDEKMKDVYFKKFPEKIGKHPDDVFLVFKPNWWRYTDWNKPEGKTILTHEGKVITMH